MTARASVRPLARAIAASVAGRYCEVSGGVGAGVDNLLLVDGTSNVLLADGSSVLVLV